VAAAMTTAAGAAGAHRSSLNVASLNRIPASKPLDNRKKPPPSDPSASSDTGALGFVAGTRARLSRLLTPGKTPPSKKSRVGSPPLAAAAAPSDAGHSGNGGSGSSGSSRSSGAGSDNDNSGFFNQGDNDDEVASLQEEEGDEVSLQCCACSQFFETMTGLTHE